MLPLRQFGLRLLGAVAIACATANLSAAEATFLRAINLNGPALTIDGRAWDGTNAADVAINGKKFENQAVALKPATDPASARMIRSSIWGDKVSVELTNVPPGAHQVFLYVWEDTINEQFDLLVNDQIVFEKFNSGTAGAWKKLGPWKCESRDGKIKISARSPSHGAANLSGLELWSGDGAIPETARAPFVTALTPEHTEFFEKRIRPVLVEHCYECHSSGAKKIKGGLVLDSRAGVIKGGDTGVAITPGDPEASLLIQAMRHTDPDLAMPKQKLPAHVLADFEAWVKLGAPDPRTEDTVAVAQAKSAIDWNKAREWWSFRPLAAPPVPKVKNVPTPIDAFILAKMVEGEAPRPDSPLTPALSLLRGEGVATGALLPKNDLSRAPGTDAANQQRPTENPLRAPSPLNGERAGVRGESNQKPSSRVSGKPRSTPPRAPEPRLQPVAEKRTLLRRATFDLIGLPPTPEEVDAFLKDKSSKAFAKVVERLLASPHYGERWGRHWLDVVRYADTAGDNSDFPIPQMFRYRDWVIRAFNRDLPYDQFIREQLAGDLLPGTTTAETHERLIATGYIANARRFGSRVEDYPQHLTIEDTIDNFGRAFLGLTINCARCHDHKFDPITAADYYALYGIFHSTRYPWPGIELEQKQRDLVPLVAPGKLAEAETARRAHDDEKRRLDKAVQKLKDQLKEIPADGKPAHEAKIKEAEQTLKEFMHKGLPFDLAYAVAEAKKFEDVAIQVKGDPAKPGDKVPRRFLTVLGGTPLPNAEKTSGRRQLAEWIVDRNNPLTARVMANRIWQHHFGKGLVPTPNDFGKQGKPPTHPELLDWLATQFIESGWSVKAMHRVIMLSATYRQTGGVNSETVISNQSGQRAATASLNTVSLNTDYSPFPRRRLDAEALRDTLLVLGGNLDTSPSAPHPFPPQTEWKFTQHNPFKAVYESKRRSVYLMTQRIQRHPYLAIFDGADPSASTALRTTSTTPLQALFLLNDKFVHEQSQAFAARVLKSGKDEKSRVRFAYETALGRPPEKAELEQCRKFLVDARARLVDSGTPATEVEAESWHAFIRTLLRLNEFAYVD